MTPEPVLSIVRELINGAASSAHCGDEENDVVDAEDDRSQRGGRHDHPQSSAARCRAPQPFTNRHRRSLVM